MFKNNLLTMLRSFKKYLFYNIINIISLSLGVLSCILLFVYINQELSYDSFHTRADDLYRINTEIIKPEGNVKMAVTVTPLEPELKTHFPDIELSTRVHVPGKVFISYNEDNYYEDKIIFAGKDFFKLFSFKLKSGSLKTFETNISSVVLTSSLAGKYFGSEDPVGKVIRYGDLLDLQVAAVIEDLPQRTSLEYSMVIPFESFKKISTLPTNNWGGWIPMYTFIRLAPNTDLEQFKAKLWPFMTNYREDRPEFKPRLFIQKVRDIHMSGNIGDEFKVNNSYANFYTVISIGLIILIMACINYINLSVAMLSGRMKEILIRKFLGASRHEIVKQFIIESIFLVYLTMIIALFAAYFFLGSFSNLFGLEFYSLPFNNIFFVIFLASLPIILGSIIGIYPALFSIKYYSINQAAGNISAQSVKAKPSLFRKGLIIVQFVSAIILIILTFLINDQMKYTRESDLGFNAENHLVVDINDKDLIKSSDALKNELMLNNKIQSVTFAGFLPISESFWEISVFPNGKTGARDTYWFLPVDFDYIDHFNLQLVAGRTLSEEISTDKSEAFLVNETTVKRLGYARPEDALGRKILTGWYGREGTIVGVLKDFHLDTFHEEIKPIILFYGSEFFGRIIIRTDGSDDRSVIAYLEKIWPKYSPRYPLSVAFYDDILKFKYNSDESALKTIFSFTIIALIISTLGLIGLALFTVSQRRKEIGIRKVLGASSLDAFYLLTREYFGWILVSNIIAWPLAYFFINKWLETFVFRISVGIDRFILSGILIAVISLLAVSSQAIKTTCLNPIEIIRYE